MGKPKGEPTERISSVVFSPDGKTLAGGSSDHTVRLWDVKTGEPKGTLTGHRHTVNSVAFSPDGKLLASSGSYDHTVRLWDTETWEPKGTLNGHTNGHTERFIEIPFSPWVTGVAFSPDGKTLAIGSTDGTLRLWKVPD